MDSILEVLKKNAATKDKINSEDKWENIKFYKPKGCSQCGKEGYHGRNGIFEVLEIDEEIRKMISQNSPAEELERKAKEKGMLSMIEDGFSKAILGITSIEEILRVTKE